MRPLRALLLFFVTVTLLPTLTFAVQPDRIAGALDSSQMVSLSGNVHGLARPEFDMGRADNGQRMSPSLSFKLSASQQRALDKLLKDQQDPASPSYHKWLTPAQFGGRFGLSQNDVNKVVAWLQGQGFTVTRIANSRNQIFFEGTVAQVELAFRTEIHNYLVNGEVHFANATEPSVPAALAGIALGVQNLHNFQPKPRIHIHKVSDEAANPHFTSYISGNHFLTPGDFATIYDVQGLYTTGGVDGTGQKIAITGQSAISLTDISHFRSAAGLSANSPTTTLVPGTGTSTVCAGDEGESDLDVEWSGGIAKNATIILVYAGLGTGTTCASRTKGAFDALQYAIDQNLAPVISNSYGNCEVNITSSFASTMETWAKQANSQGQTIFSASGDSGAADCDFQVKSATQGFAVDIPAAIPEVTGAGGTEFSADSPTCMTSCPPGGDPPYWAAAGTTTDTISSALEYIPEMGWNDTTFDIAHGGSISASGGGKSTFFTKPPWQTGTGVPADGQRDVPDLAVSASADHDGYLFCTSDSGAVTCTNGFRDNSSNLSVVGGTSAAAPTLSGVMALFNQYFGNTPPGGLGNINPNLYKFFASNPSAFNDVTTGNNIVPCTKGTTDCPTTSPFQYGFTAGSGYDQVTGLGSIKAFTLAQAWFATMPHFTMSPSPSSITAKAGQTSGSTTITVNAQNGFSGTVTFSCSGLPSGATCNFNPTSSTGSTSLTVQTLANMAAATTQFNVNGTSGSLSNATSVSLNVTASGDSFQLTPAVNSLSLAPGATSGNTVGLTVTDTGNTGFIVTNGGNQTTVLPVTYTCSLPASEASCSVSPSPTSVINPTVTIMTTAPTAKLHPPLMRETQFVYAMLLPGVLGIVFLAGSKRRGVRMLSLMIVLGCSTLWVSSCGGGGGGQKNPGTPAGSYTVTVNATTGGSAPITASTSIALTVQ